MDLMAKRPARAGRTSGGPLQHAGRLRSGSRRRSPIGELAFAGLLLLIGVVATARAQDTPDAAIAGGATGGPAPVSTVADSPPAGLHDPDAWLAWRDRMNVDALPDEARVFFRRGLDAWASGNEAEGMHLVRAAGLLDPYFASPHATLASWYLTREPSQSLQEWGTLLRLVRDDFRLQFDLAANALFFLFHGLFFGILATAGLVLLLHLRELRHMLVERLRMFVSAASATAWSWALLVLPFLTGFGIVAPLLAMLGVLWPQLRPRERAVPVMLAVLALAAPLASTGTGRLAAPLQATAAPFFGVMSLQHAPFAPARLAELRRASESHPGEPFLQFALAWVANRGGDAASAEAAYRVVLQRWPNDDRTLNNLGNLLAAQGRFDDALELYGRATRINPKNAYALFNASQVHTRGFDYRAASEAVSRAAALDFELVQRFRARGSDGALLLADQWIAPKTFWLALATPSSAARATPQLPPAWRGIREASGWPAAAAAVAFGAIGMAIGMAWHRRLPLRACSNCETVVCRRCSERRREVALCPGCAGAAARAESADFEHVLLDQHRRGVQRVERSLRTALAGLLPGFGFVVFRRMALAALTGIAVALLVTATLGVPEPFDVEPAFGIAGSVGLTALAAGWVIVYVVGIAAFVARQAHLDAQSRATPVRSRVATASRVKLEAA
jgi:tetratricopeptide (TPR) repeat protein